MKRLLIVLLLLPFVSASMIEQADTVVTMRGTFVNVSASYQISSNRVEDITFALPLDAYNLKFFLNGVKQECKFEPSKEEQRVRCGDTTLGANNVKLVYTSKDLLGWLEEQQVFKFTDKLPFKAKLYKFSLVLSEGYVIPAENGLNFYLTPDPFDVTSDGRHIIIDWQDEDITRFSNLAIIKPLVADSSWDIAFFLSITALAAAFSSLVILVRKKPEKNNEILLPGFIEDEQKVVELLQNAPNNELWQKTIQQDCDFSKAKVSRIVRNLEARGVVSKESFGNANKVKLKKEEQESS